jgi:hypothetical protein
MTEDTATFYFDNLESAASALIVVLLDARTSAAEYRFGPLKAEKLLSSGMHLSGDTEAVSAKLANVPGAVRHDS